MKLVELHSFDIYVSFYKKAIVHVGSLIFFFAAFISFQLQKLFPWISLVSEQKGLFFGESEFLVSNNMSMNSFLKVLQIYSIGLFPALYCNKIAIVSKIESKIQSPQCTL